MTSSNVSPRFGFAMMEATINEESYAGQPRGGGSIMEAHEP